MKQRGLGLYAAALYAFLHLPLVILTVFSFNSSKFTVWEGFSLRWYRAVITDPNLAEAALNSVEIAIASTILSTIVGTACAYGFWKRRDRLLSSALYLSLVTPEIVMGVSLLAFFQWTFRFLHWRLGLHTVILAHVAFSIAYVVIVVAARLRTLDASLEEAAMDLGANEWGAFRLVTLPALLPGIAAAAMLALTVSFDDYVITSMVAGVDSETLPVWIYATARRGANPAINAISAIIVVFFGALILLSERLEEPGAVNRRTFFLGLTGLAGCTRDQRPRLNVYNWSNYVAPDTIANFEREFGVRVRYGVYESNEEMLAKALTGNSGWDVVFPSNYLIRAMRENELLAPLRHDWLGNLGNLDARFRAPSWDSELRWSVPYMWGASGIVFDRKVTPAPAAWSDLWRPALRNRMTMLDDGSEVLGACLKKLGYSINSSQPEELAKARREAVAQKQLLRAYLNAEARDQLVSGDILAAQLWATTSQQAMDAAPALEFVYPTEGFALYADNAVVLRESRRERLAHQFIDYLLRPAVGADIVKTTRTATANAAVLALLPESVRSSPTLYPPEEVLRRGEWFEPLPTAAQRMRDRLWTEIKSA